MKTLVFAALGLLTGALLSSLFTTGCGCPEGEPLAAVPAGDYVPDPASKDPVEGDYRLTLSADFTAATETFTRGGKAYQIRYTVTKGSN